jgi:CHASE2 domain-containing sensor protein
MIAVPATRPSIRFDRLPTWALGGAGCGLLAEVSLLPSAVKAVLLLAFIVVGPGSVAVQRFGPTLPLVAVRALVPVTGLAVVLLTSTGALFMGVWSPRVTLLALAVVTAIAGAAQLWSGRDRTGPTP